MRYHMRPIKKTAPHILKTLNSRYFDDGYNTWITEGGMEAKPQISQRYFE